jgi:hypothetical protein
VTDPQVKGVSPATIQKVGFIPSAIFTAAERRDLLAPCKGVKTPTVPKKPPKIKIITPEQFDTICLLSRHRRRRQLTERPTMRYQVGRVLRRRPAPERRISRV